MYMYMYMYMYNYVLKRQPINTCIYYCKKVGTCTFTSFFRTTAIATHMKFHTRIPVVQEVILYAVINIWNFTDIKVAVHSLKILQRPSVKSGQETMHVYNNYIVMCMINHCHLCYRE